MILEQSSYQNFLQEELQRRLRANANYSLRAFARDLGVSPGELSEILREKRHLSLKSALKIAEALGLTQTETKWLVYLIEVEKSKILGKALPMRHEEKTLEFDLRKQQLTMDLFRIVSDWYCFAILNLSDCEYFRWDAIWIAKRLGISVHEVRGALDRLKRVGLIEVKNGKLQAVKDYVISPEGIPSEAIRNYHHQILQRANRALDAQPTKEREFSGVGLAIDPRNIAEIKKEIATFLDSIVSKYSKGKQSEVYQLELVFFKLTEGPTQ